MIIGEYAMQLQVSNPAETWYGQIEKSMWAMDAISKLATAAFANGIVFEKDLQKLGNWIQEIQGQENI